MSYSSKTDGLDHINIYSKGKTILGKYLSHFTKVKIRTIYHGTFLSVEGYWYWLLTRNDNLRSLYGFEAKKVRRESSLVFPDYDLTDEFKKKDKNSKYIKVTV